MARIFPLFFVVALILVPSTSTARLNPIKQELALYDCGKGNEKACSLVRSSILFTGYLVGTEERKLTLQSEVGLKRAECDKGNVTSCTDLGIILFNQQPNDNAEAYALFNDACDLGDGWACNVLGEVSDVVKTSAAENFHAYYNQLNELCVNKDNAACASHARLNVLIADAVPEKSIWYDQLVSACSHNVSRACVNLSYLMSDDGKEEYKNFDLGRSILDRFTRRSSFSYAKKACELSNPMGCWNLALAYSDGHGVKADDKSAQEYFVKACVGGVYMACNEINYQVYWRWTDSDKAINTACEQGDFTACLISEQRRHKALGESLSQTAVNNHLESLVEICIDGSWLACANAAVLSRRQGDSSAAERFAHVSCNREISEGCFVLGNVWKFDKRTKGHHRQAVYYLERACELGSRGACNNLGDSYRKGLGVKSNLIRAQRYFTIACNRKLKLGCKNLAAVKSGG